MSMLVGSAWARSTPSPCSTPLESEWEEEIKGCGTSEGVWHEQRGVA